jgi:hypothetical protein
VQNVCEVIRAAVAKVRRDKVRRDKVRLDKVRRDFEINVAQTPACLQARCRPCPDGPTEPTGRLILPANAHCNRPVAKKRTSGAEITPLDPNCRSATAKITDPTLGAPIWSDYSIAAFAGDTPRWTNLKIFRSSSAKSSCVLFVPVFRVGTRRNSV